MERTSTRGDGFGGSLRFDGRGVPSLCHAFVEYGTRGRGSEPPTRELKTGMCSRIEKGAGELKLDSPSEQFVCVFKTE